MLKKLSVFPLAQVEYALSDLDYVEKFFAEVFHEQSVEEVFAAALSNDFLEIRHRALGQTVQQLCKPPLAGLPHYTALQQYGPCIHNLCFIVDDIAAIVSNCAAAGIKSLLEFPMTDIWSTVIEKDNLSGNHQSYIFDSKAVFGFHLELAETPWKSTPEPALLYPAYDPLWEQRSDNGNRLSSINIIITNLDETLAQLAMVFGDNLSILDSPTAHSATNNRTATVSLGEVTLHYVEANAADKVLTQLLDKRGPSIHSLVIEVADSAATLNRAQQFGIAVGPCDSFVELGASNPNRQQFNTLDNIGVNFIIQTTSQP